MVDGGGGEEAGEVLGGFEVGGGEGDLEGAVGGDGLVLAVDVVELGEGLEGEVDADAVTEVGHGAAEEVELAEDGELVEEEVVVVAVAVVAPVTLAIVGELEVEALGEGAAELVDQEADGDAEAQEAGGGDGQIEGEGRSAVTRSRGAKLLLAVLAARMGSRKRASLAWAVATMLEEVRGSMSRRERAAAAAAGWV
jgi:hypothetical protein